MALSQRTESELLWPPRPPISMLGSCAVELAEFFALGRNADGKRCDFVFQGVGVSSENTCASPTTATRMICFQAHIVLVPKGCY